MATEGTVVSVALTQVSSQRLGYSAITLTNFTDTAEPAIAAGSKIEIGGSLYGFSGTTSIDSWSGIGTASLAYIYMVPAGTAVSVSFLGTAPSWDEAQQAYYGGDDRAIGTVWKASTAGYDEKLLYAPFQRRETFGSHSLTISADYSVGDADGRDTYYVDASAGTVVLTLPTLADNPSRTIHIQAVATGSVPVVITPEGSETIQGATAAHYLQHSYAAMTLDSQGGGTDWVITSGDLQQFILPIGDWDMDADDFVAVAHGMWSEIYVTGLSAIIRNDSAAIYSSFDFDQGLSGFFPLEVQPGGGTVIIRRVAGGKFDGSAYDSTGISRGTIRVMYRT